MKTAKVLNNQSIWDIAIQEYGSIEGIKQLIIDNPTIDLENSLILNTELKISGAVINKKVVEFFSNSIFKPATAIEQPMLSNWILATGLWNDNGFWDDNALWIY